MKERYVELDLQLFGEGGDGGAAAAGDAGESAAPSAGGEDLSQVVYGKAQPEPQNAMPNDRAKAFTDLIKGEYKDEYARHTQRMIDTRFKAAKAMEAQQQAMQPALDALCARYGLHAEDSDFAAKLTDAIAKDDLILGLTAEQQGLTVDQLRARLEAEKETAPLRAAQEEQRRQEAANAVLSDWVAQGQQLEQIYPGFRLDVEANGPHGEQFLQLLQAGVNVRTAYEVVHKDELLGGALRYAVHQAEKRTMDNIRARGLRPAEAGAQNQNAGTTITKPDPANWSDADMNEVLRRVKAGERIVL